jgi:hypothetical protein
MWACAHRNVSHLRDEAAGHDCGEEVSRARGQVHARSEMRVVCVARCNRPPIITPSVTSSPLHSLQ